MSVSRQDRAYEHYASKPIPIHLFVRDNLLDYALRILGIDIN